jgi:lipopolysaccharide export system ATP-binding protein
LSGRPVALEADGLVKTYGGRRVVDTVSFAVHPGEVLGLLGPNGAGKSTVFRMLAGVEVPDAGSIRLHGQDVARLPLYRRARLGLGWLAQDDALFRELTVAENVLLAADAAGTDADPVELLRRTGVPGVAQRRIEGLSGGERKRVAIARLLALRPKVLLLDEPFAGVDPVAVRGLALLVRELASQGLAVVLTDHAVRDALGTCDRALLMDGGDIHVQGTPEQVAADAHARARYLGADFTLASALRHPIEADTIGE